MFTINTKRLILRDLTAEDWKLFIDLMNEPETRRYMDGYLKAATEDEARQWVTEMIGYNNENPRHSYNLVLECDGIAIGWIGIGEAETEEKKDLDFGYALKKERRGQGYATEALKALISYCLKTMDIQRITGECETQNLASQRVMEKAGMTREKKIVIKDKKTGQEKEKFRYAIFKP